MDKILTNKVFISTRPEGSSEELKWRLAAAGGEMAEMPLIQIEPVRLSEKERELLNDLTRFQWIVFTSSNGVHFFFSNLKTRTGNHLLPPEVKTAVIGNMTCRALNSYGYHPAFVNPGNTAEDFVHAFIPEIRKREGRVTILLPLGTLSRKIIQERLSEFASCFRINLYQTCKPPSTNSEMLQRICNDQYEMLIFTSPSAVQNFMELAGEVEPKNLRVACIGETTSREVRKKGMTPLVIAGRASAKGIVESIVQFYK